MPGLLGFPSPLRDILVGSTATDARINQADVLGAKSATAIAESQRAISGLQQGNLAFKDARPATLLPLGGGRLGGAYRPPSFDAPSARSVPGDRRFGAGLPGPLGAQRFVAEPSSTWRKLAAANSTSITANLIADPEGHPVKRDGYGNVVPTAVHFNPEARVPTEAAPRWARFEPAPERRSGALFDVR